MIVSKPENIEPIIIDNGNIEKRVLMGSNVGAQNFVMRLFTLKPGAKTPYHSHDWEHEIFVLEGTIEAVTNQKSYKAEKGNFIFVPSNEEHQFVNAGKEPAKFLCVIPYMPGNE
ncbi:cupin domain-containing protein [Thermosipho ferrireducens]|uniref:Cupin domain-containing protein n=1 Tax=Thermosipho ferrireducens TaxID=2571116 RepID=A0ABX7S4V7_9BACT|nr:cupin domain-containing protein [Thermosipho ferrireducens]QTA37519.1 cupin domain-containing protein [Thermosipho ferrireducens]